MLAVPVSVPFTLPTEALPFGTTTPVVIVTAAGSVTADAKVNKATAMDFFILVGSIWILRAGGGAPIGISRKTFAAMSPASH